ncbi:4'-phosphopantetheinyl transferase superfamily protein [Streptomyces sp. XM83C]|uniref:4'-phosphopantetheinyl transferase n=1 Tax=Streptomyces thermocoprophilus TaxID=78356 RepID=A0ABV5VH62_9ACTN|nr:4'-phosphopantetheinyl transferase superfamily protein [Streptomyces sp. XM83C]MCK1820751.1 4'-phosphopantetheinyl transferase superfamily protein [Streptomyces sp. XM83C]
MIEELLPASVVAVEARPDDAAAGALEAALHPEEVALVARAVAKRRREFAVVRACARRAMEKLGVPPQPVLSGERGAPRWPRGIVGSMTHCDSYCAAALARVTDLASLGIDAEPHGPLPEGVEPAVTLPGERDRLRRLTADHPGIRWGRLLFSAKESVYKAWYPLTGRWLDFSEADIELWPDPDTGGDPEAGGDVRARGGLRAELLVPGPVVEGRRVRTFEGRWTVRQGLVATAIVVPYDSGTRP